MIIQTQGQSGSSVVGGTLTILTDPGAAVTAESGSTSLSTTADSEGLANFTLTSNGNYTITSTKDNTTYDQEIISVGEGHYSTTFLSTTGGSLTVLTLPDATVTADCGDIHLSTVADSNGLATFTLASNGNYAITSSPSSTSPYFYPIHSVVSIGGGYYSLPLNTEDTSVTIGVLEDCEWGLISKLSSSGAASSYWGVGDTKTIHVEGTVGTLDVNSDYKVFILGFDHNSTKEGKGISFGTFKTTDNKDIALVDSFYGSDDNNPNNLHFSMNAPLSTAGGWQNSKMRYTTLGSTNSQNAQYAPSTTTRSPVSNSLMAALPADLRIHLKPITIYSDNVGTGKDIASNVTDTTDYLPLMSEFEVIGTRKYANSSEQNYQQQFAYYRNGNSYYKNKSSSIGAPANYWTRSVCIWGTAQYFLNITSSYGPSSMVYATTSLGVAPRFLV